MLLFLPLLQINSGIAQPNDLAMGEAVFNHCVPCHLQSGEGVHGIFPPVRNRLAPIAADPLGREYLISVILEGLAGPATVDGVTYNGYMQGYQQSLSNEQISAVLNYIAVKVADETPSDFSAFSPEEVARVRLADTSDKTTTHEKRQRLDIR